MVGIWHGPDWKFVAYGLYNGILICAGILFGPQIDKIIIGLHIKTENFSWRFFKICGTFFLVTIGRFFSRADSYALSINMIKWTILNFNPWIYFDGTLLKLGIESQDLIILVLGLVMLFIVGFLQENGIQIREKLSQQNILFRWSIYLVAIFSIIIFGVYGISYNNLDFIYRGF